MGHIRSTNGAPTVASMIFGGLVQAPMTRREAWHLIEPVRCALQRILDHVRNPDDVAIVGMAFNHGYLRAVALDRPAEVEALNAGSFVLNVITEGYELDADEAELLKEAINLWDSLVRRSSLRQWAAVEAELLAIVSDMTRKAAQAA
jgi:hypothetical protein